MKTWSKPTTETTSTPSGANNLNDLSDVAIANPQPNQILKYDGTTFINSEVPGLADIQANFNNLNADNLTAGTINYSRLPNLAGVVLSGDAVPPYISSITPITPSGPQTIEILGEYFSPITQLSIPGVTVSSLEVRSPNKIIANISKSGLSGNKIITLSNGSNSNQIWSEGIKSIDILTDPYWANVSLFIKGDGINDSIDIFDESPSPKTVTRFGDTKISTSQSKYGGSSIYFDGVGDYLQASITDGLGANDFTLEFWVYKLSDSGMVFNSRGSGGFGSDGIDISQNLNITTSGQVIFSAVTLSINAWHHIAICRKQGGMTRFINGIPTGTANNTNNFTASLFSVGGSTGGNIGYLNGYIDSFRITKGVGRYTTNFNPETDTFLNI